MEFELCSSTSLTALTQGTLNPPPGVTEKWKLVQWQENGNYLVKASILYSEL